MKLTDEKILVLASTWGIGAEGRVMWEPFVISFARAILREAGAEELERDAERYRWLKRDAGDWGTTSILRVDGITYGGEYEGEFLAGDAADALIDKEMAQHEQ